MKIWKKFFQTKITKPQFPIENIDYKFDDISDLTTIEILSIMYKGVIFTIDYAFIQTPEDSSDPILKFEYTIVYNNGFSGEELNSPEFKTCIGDILMAIIMKGI